MLDTRLITKEKINKAWSPNSGGQFTAATCPYEEILLHGDRGGGKTDLLLFLYLRHVGKGYGRYYLGIIFRCEFKHLGDLVKKSKIMIPKMFPTAKFKASASEYKWVFDDGEELLFRHAKKASDYDQFHGWEIPFIGFDELTKFPSMDFYENMKSCLRSSFVGMPFLQVSATNPSGVCHNEVKAYFIDMAPAGVPILGDDGIARVHIRITFLQNPFINKNNPKYILRLKAIKDPMLRAAWLKGDWNIVSGGAFDDLWDESIHVFDSRKISFPNYWKITRSLDWGSSAPFSVGWWITCPEDTVLPWMDGEKRIKKGTKFRIGEWYGGEKGQKNKGLRLTNKKIAQGIKEREQAKGWKVSPGAADSAIFARPNEEEKSIHDTFEAEGVPFEPAPKGPGSRITRMSLMRDRLEASFSNIMEDAGIFVSDQCRVFIKQIPLLKRDEQDIEKVDTDQEDHLYDEASYELINYESQSGMLSA